MPVARKALFTAVLATDLVWYAKYSSERSVDPQATVRAEGYLHRLTLFVEDAYLNTRQRPNYEIDVRSRHLENTFEAGGEYRMKPKFSLGVSGRRAITEVRRGRDVPRHQPERHVESREHRVQGDGEAPIHAVDDRVGHVRRLRRSLSLLATAQHRHAASHARHRVQAACARRRVGLGGLPQIHTQRSCRAPGVRRTRGEPRALATPCSARRRSASATCAMWTIRSRKSLRTTSPTASGLSIRRALASRVRRARVGGPASLRVSQHADPPDPCVD